MKYLSRKEHNGDILSIDVICDCREGMSLPFYSRRYNKSSHFTLYAEKGSTGLYLSPCVICENCAKHNLVILNPPKEILDTFIYYFQNKIFSLNKRNSGRRIYSKQAAEYYVDQWESFKIEESDDT